jgi:membrane fusion protein, adhesin transport system
VAASFDQTMRALRADRSRGTTIGAAIAIALAAGWIGWMVLARVPVYQSGAAKIEVAPGPSHVASPVGGRVISVHLALGAKVAVGDVLVTLDDQAERVALDRARTQLAILDPQLAAIDRELATDVDAVSAGGAAARSAASEQLARVRAADAEVVRAEDELARETSLVHAGASPTADLDRARAEVTAKHAARDALGHASDSLVASERERDAGRRGRTAALERQRAELEGSLATARTEVTRLELERERRTIRASTGGMLGSVATLAPGAVLAAGDGIATIVPAGTLRVVAALGAAAIGRVAPGQRARLKLDGFPWTRWGSVEADVTSVANEMRDGALRVELAVAPGSPIELVHGMAGTVDIEIEHASPAALVVRALVVR